VNESVIGTIFRGRVLSETKLGRFDAVIPEIEGDAHVLGFANWIIDERDPLTYGFWCAESTIPTCLDRKSPLMTRPTMQIFDAAATARLIPYAALVDALKRATIDYAQQRIVSPERLVVPLNEGGIMLSMPATAPDLAIHKLVNVCASNGPRGIPTIHRQVMAFDADTGETLFILDGPTVTGRRTAAMSMLGILTFAPARPREFLLIGTGTQAANQLEAIGQLFPAARGWGEGSAPARAAQNAAARAGALPSPHPRAAGNSWPIASS
ncbi:proline racemase family protein, partial [Escherichia coli]|nr:proline racemase family protein [Escherichia coli]